MASPAELRSYGVAATKMPQPMVHPWTPFSGLLCRVLRSRGVCSARGGRGVGEFLACTHAGFLPADDALREVGISVAAVQPC